MLSQAEMVDSDYIIGDRSLPGILILNSDKEPSYISEEGRALIKALNNTGEHYHTSSIPIPTDILELCNCASGTFGTSSSRETKKTSSAIISRGNDHYLVRIAPVSKAGDEQTQSHTMVVIEPYVSGRQVNILNIRARYTLTERESEVVEEIIHGKTNRQIAEKLCISEDTIKFHVKKIMNKLCVSNRASILSKLFR